MNGNGDFYNDFSNLKVLQKEGFQTDCNEINSQKN